MEPLYIQEVHNMYKIIQHPVHGLHLVSYFDTDSNSWMPLSTCLTSAECHHVIKYNEETTM